MVIRKATKKDIPGLLVLMERIGYLNFRFKGKSEDYIRKQITKEFSDRTFLIMKIRDKVIGYSIIGKASKFFKTPLKVKRGYAFSLGIGIDKDYQGKGYGKKLKMYTFRYIKRQGYKGMYTDVASNNYKSLKLQESTGFKKIAEYDDSKRKKGIKNVVFVKD